MIKYILYGKEVAIMLITDKEKAFGIRKQIPRMAGHTGG